MKAAMELQKQTATEMFQMMKSVEERVGKLEENTDAPASGGGTSKRHEQPPQPEGEGNDEVLRLRGPSANLNHDAPPFVNPKPNGSGPSYAMMAVKNTHGNNFVRDNDGFIVCGPNGKPLRPVKPVNNFPHAQNVKKTKTSDIGKSNRNTLTAATRVMKANVFATRYVPGTTAEAVKADLKADERLKDLDICVESVTTKYDTYASFHVTCVCTENETKLFLEADVWPSGILYRPWKEKRKPRKQLNFFKRGFYSHLPS